LNTPFNRIIQDPNLYQVLQEHARNIFLDLNCHAVATVTEVDYANQQVQAEMAYTKNFLVRQSDGTYQNTSVEYAGLVGCPFIILQGGDAGLTFPIAVGDDCLIFFNDKDLSNWQTGVYGQVPQTNSCHSFSNAIALIGLNNSQNLIDGYDTARAKLYNGQTQITVGTKIGIQNATQNLLTSLQNLISAFTSNASDIILATGGPGGPSPLNPAVVSALNDVNTALGELLE